MSANRNAPCPCGSGKKYKKCCLNKEKNIELSEVKEERFLQQKHVLVTKMKKFVEDKIPFNEFLQLKSEFSKRSNSNIPANIQDGFFQFWLYFCYRFENGLRGIEWFYQQHQARLQDQERAMANNWTSLSLKLLQGIKKEDNVVWFEDVFTKEQFSVIESRENIPEFMPWYSTIGMLEEFEGHNYFNGVRIFKGPDELQQAARLVQELTEQKNLSVEHVLFEYYPEILSAFVEEHYGLSKEDMDEKVIQEYTVEYKVLNEEQLESFLDDHDDLIVDVWDKQRKKLSWTGNWRVFKDSQLDEGIQIADVHATISFTNEKLAFICFDADKKAELMEIFNESNSGVQFLSEKEKQLKIPFNAVIKNSFVQMSEDTPRYFSIFAQTDLFASIDLPLPKYGDVTIRELVENGQVELAEAWLRQMEYNLYQHALKQYEKLEITADFNSIRKQLGLPLSPFVTGGNERQSSIESIENPYKKELLIPEADIPFYEDLGLTPSTINNFYAEDLVAFYKKKTIGKGDGTVRKYRNSLTKIRKNLEISTTKNWEDCDSSFWEKLFTSELIEAEESVSKSFQKDFLSTIKALAKWLDQINGLSISQAAGKAITEMEKGFVKS